MDGLDRKIIEQLCVDSSLTSEQLGALIGLSASATHRRVQMLESSGMIIGYHARLGRAARGNPTIVYVSVTLADQTQPTLAAYEAAILACREVREAHLMSGESDYLLKVEIAETDSYERVHRDILAAMPGVRRLVTQFSIRTIRGQD
jgi:Lrp/AsnC family transcriptional regulator, leucine-responsive regulatory protein